MCKPLFQQSNMTSHRISQCNKIILKALFVFFATTFFIIVQFIFKRKKHKNKSASIVRIRCIRRILNEIYLHNAADVSDVNAERFKRIIFSYFIFYSKPSIMIKCHFNGLSHEKSKSKSLIITVFKR